MFNNTDKIFVWIDKRFYIRKVEYDFDIIYIKDNVIVNRSFIEGMLLL